MTRSGSPLARRSRNNAGAGPPQDGLPAITKQRRIAPALFKFDFAK